MPLAAAAGLQAIEWGGDIHVPHGDLAAAERVRRLTCDAGLQVSCYGSYSRAGEGGDAAAVVDTALALGAPTIRIWAGKRGSADADAQHWEQVVAACRSMLEHAAGKPVNIVFETHGGTLTDTLKCELELLRRLSHPQIGVCWQPPNGQLLEPCEEWLKEVLPWTHHLHVFHWWPTSAARLPLRDGAARWRRYLSIARDHAKYATLEFFKGDSVEQMRADAQTLRELLATNEWSQA